MGVPLIFAAAGLLLTAVSLPAQVAAPQLDSVARRIVAGARYATFVTVDRAGSPQVRTVQPRAPETGWDVWFATNPRTRKVAEVERNGAVALHYFDPATESYVAVTGRARVIRDRVTRDAHWDPAWNAFYPDRDQGVLLIAVQAERVEVVSPQLGVNSDAATWRPQSFSPRAPKPTLKTPKRTR